ncbi:hypothetical protein B0T16DRAFT_113085 [Cercophora newfieldiana]|uniref:F-box domain-containing protein n=1 Tax=Cercophora newfieldiana TaxID=92897 RepID=A0AA39YAS3_9PEZI|nr:hypothetical protein B0T16DRAFT_113085 [Cercophora newfieldiana]
MARKRPSPTRPESAPQKTKADSPSAAVSTNKTPRVTLDGMPTEILLDIFGYLRSVKPYGGEDFSGIRKLRLVSKRIRDVADIADIDDWREFVFSIRRDHLRDLLRVAKKKGEHVTSLVYLVEVLYPIRQTYRQYELHIRSQERYHDLHFPAPLSRDDVFKDWEKYCILVQQQEDTLDNHRDYKVLHEAIPQFPNLRNITVSYNNEFRIRPLNKPPYRRCPPEFIGNYDQSGMYRLHSILRAVQAAGTRLHSLRASSIQLDFFEPDFFNHPKYGLGAWLGLLDNLTDIALTIEVVDDGAWDPTENIQHCRKTMDHGVLRRILDNAPKLATIKIAFFGSTIWPGRHPAPAKLNSILPLNRVWPGLKSISLSHVETERQEITRFLKRHKDSLEELKLESVQLGRTSWIRLLRDLRENFGDGAHLKTAHIFGFIKGKTEDHSSADDETESWRLTYPKRSRYLSSETIAMQTYIISAEEQECPLKKDNMCDDGEESYDEAENNEEEEEYARDVNGWAWLEGEGDDEDEARGEGGDGEDHYGESEDGSADGSEHYPNTSREHWESEEAYRQAVYNEYRFH